MSVATGKELAHLGTRSGFNHTLRHIVNVTNLIEEASKGANLADLLNPMLEQGILRRNQLPPILAVILVEKLNVPYRAVNLKKGVSDFGKIVETFGKWTGVNLVAAYSHPNLDLNLVNPANQEHWNIIHEVKANELLVVYAQANNAKRETAEKALDAFFTMLDGGTPAEDPDFIKAAAPTPPPPPPPPARAAAAPPPPPPPRAAAPQAAPAQQQAAPQAAPRPAARPKGKPGGKRNITPKYSVQVTNELFHNGNVEAWKNIIESYEAKTNNEIIVYHEGELIQDLNSLFKWGKVKHGGLIMFQVMGYQIKGVSRLQKYLHEGASSRYETFMKHDVNKILNLF
ncbi:MAG: hypothetical protein NXI24_12785 [bacterium]|nr:hypothetical protein [bacterium]